tara:strand:+ start:3877 stop:5682 length:1806 start_codon:yes stop_codon:yes gene_type:complete
MANTIKHKRGSGSNPAASSLSVGELAIRTDTGVVFTKKDDGTVAEIAGGGETNLGVSTTTTAVTVTSDTGNNATISEASSSAAGVMSAAHHDKLDGIATGATANSTESIQDIVGGMVSGNSESGISVTYQDGDGTLDFSVTSQTDNNFTTTLKNKLDGIESGAEVNVATNLSKTTTTTTNVIASSTGTNVTLNEATGSAAGLMSTTHHNKLDGIESGATADQSASEILTAIKTVDGGGSGLDADTLDGLQHSSFLRSDTADTKTSGDLTFNDGVKANFGNGSDLQIYHNGSHSYIYDSGSGNLTLRTNGFRVNNAANSENIITANQDAEVNLFYNNSNKLQTKSDGVNITGELQCDSLDVDGAADITGTVTLHGNLDLQDSDYILLGSGDDLQIFHDGSNSYVKDNGTGSLILETNGHSVDIKHGGEYCARFKEDADVELYYNNSKKLETKSDGVDIVGELQCDSLDVDGAANITGNVDINGDIRHNGDTNCLFGFPANDTFRVSTGGTERFRITSTGAIAIEGSSNYGSSGQVLTSNGNDAPTWQDGGGTVASGCVYENSQTISANYSVTSGKNAMSAGPITIASGVTVTVTSGSTYTIV